MTTLGWAEWGEFTASLSDKSGSDYSLIPPFVPKTRERFTFVQTEANHPWRLLVSSGKESDSFCRFQSVHCPLQKTTQSLAVATITRATHNSHTRETESGGSQWQLWSQRPLQLQVNLILYRLTEMDLSNLCCWRGTKSNLNNSRAAPIFKLLLFWTEGREGLKKKCKGEICLSESGMGKQSMVKCFYTSCFTSVIDGVGSDFGGTRRCCFRASLYCSRGISFNIKGQNSHFAISQQLLSPEPRRKTFTLQTSLSSSHS